MTETAMQPELRWLRAFLAVAEENHFSRAARRLHLAQPALSTQIQQLEEAVGARLFDRTNRLSGLTAAGRALLPEAQSLIERADQLARTVRRAARGESGQLRLGLIPPAATTAVAETLRRFTRDHPNFEIHVSQAGQHRLESRLAAGELDLVIGRPPDGVAARQLGHRKLLVEDQGILLRADDPLAATDPVPLARLANCRLILLHGNPHFGGNVLNLAAVRGVPLVPIYAADDFPSLHWLVRAGLGIAPCSLLLNDSLPAGLVARRLRPAPPRLPIHVLWRGAGPPPAAARWLQLLQAAPAPA